MYRSIVPRYFPRPLSHINTEIKQILWKDEDGADSEGLVNKSLFNNIIRWLKPKIIEFVNRVLFDPGFL